MASRSSNSAALFRQGDTSIPIKAISVALQRMKSVRKHGGHEPLATIMEASDKKSVVDSEDLRFTVRAANGMGSTLTLTARSHGFRIRRGYCAAHPRDDRHLGRSNRAGLPPAVPGLVADPDHGGSLGNDCLWPADAAQKYSGDPGRPRAVRGRTAPWHVGQPLGRPGTAVVSTSVSTSHPSDRDAAPERDQGRGPPRRTSRPSRSHAFKGSRRHKWPALRPWSLCHRSTRRQGRPRRAVPPRGRAPTSFLPSLPAGVPDTSAQACLPPPQALRPAPGPCHSGGRRVALLQHELIRLPG
jgi:hypothetical protein